MSEISQELARELKAKSMILQSDRQRFTVRLSVTGGRVEARQMQAVAALAERFGRGVVHLTTRQGMEIPDVEQANLEPLREALVAAGIELASAGKSVRSIIACPGRLCKFGQIDSQALARSLHTRFARRGNLPAKFKMAVTGCPNSCVKPIENDFGVAGAGGGQMKIYVGGRMGRKPRLANLLPVSPTTEREVLDLAEAVFSWYCANGAPGERLGATIDRLGLPVLVEAIGGQQGLVVLADG